MKTIVFCAALPQEIKALCSQLGIQIPCAQTRVSPPIEIDGWRVFVLSSGVGLLNMQNVLHSFPQERVELWISIGLAGALVPDVDVGDCLIGHSIKTLQGEHYDFEYPHSLDENIDDRALLCVSEMADTPQKKRDFHRQSGAVAVDMESAAVAKQALQRGEHFLWLRAISDGLEENLPIELKYCLDDAGFPSMISTMNVLVHKPLLLGSFIRMGNRTHRLSQRLAECVPQLMDKYR